MFEALGANNQNVGGGMVTSGGQAQLVHGIGRVTSIEQIEDIVVTAYDGSPVYIRDLAQEVRIGHEIRRGAVTADGKGTVTGIRIDPQAVDSEDVEMLEDLVLAAVSQAQTRARERLEAEMKQATGGMPMPDLGSFFGG